MHHYYLKDQALYFVLARYGPWEVLTLCVNLFGVSKAFPLIKIFSQERSRTAHLRISQWINYILALTYYGINWHIVTCVLLYILLCFHLHDKLMCLLEFWLWLFMSDVCMCLRVKWASWVWYLEAGSKMQDCRLPFVLFLCFINACM